MGWMVSDELHDSIMAAGIVGLVFHKDLDNREWK
jgi:hypothetical protein